MRSIFSFTQGAFAESIFAQLGRGKLHAAALYSHFMKNGNLEGLQVEPQAQKLIQEILSITDFALPEHEIVHHENGTLKFLLKLHDGYEVESVFIPMKTKSTLCISSQVGCKMGCAFCETGRMGLLRQLTASEIVAQVFIAIHKLKMGVGNLVFMGMGEPFDNLDEVTAAIDVLTEDSGLGIGPSNITVSTSGLVDKIDAFSKKVDPAVNLAVSVNAPSDEIRRKIMPVNKTWNMQELKEAMERYCAHPRREIFIEYVLLQGINDSIECADLLASYLQGLKVKVNLIPYNPQSRDRFAPPDSETTLAFSTQMRSHGYFTLVRQTKGQNIMAACGQLGNLELRKQRRLKGHFNEI